MEEPKDYIKRTERIQHDESCRCNELVAALVFGAAGIIAGITICFLWGTHG